MTALVTTHCFPGQVSGNEAKFRGRAFCNGAILCIRVRTQLLREANKKVQIGNDQEKAQSEKDFHSKNRGGKKLN